MIIGQKFKYRIGVITYLGIKNIPIASHIMPHYEFQTENGSKLLLTIREFNRLKLAEIK